MAQPERTDDAPRRPDPSDARFEALVRDYARLVRHAIRAAGGGQIEPLAEDIEQKVFLALWQQVRREQTIDHPVSYLYQAAVRETVRAVRRAHARPEVGLEEVGDQIRHQAESNPGPERAALDAERRRMLAEALVTLQPDRARAVRAHLQGFSVQEIMTLFAWDYQKARNLVARGMANLREALRERGLDGA
jgi:RNA polymerase sigma factor (sigma-70 family)